MKKRFWRIMALALAAVLTGCGAGGRDFRVQEQDAQSVQEAQNVQGVQDTKIVQDIQVAQAAQDVRETQDIQDTQDTQDKHDVQDKQDARGTQGPQEAQAHAPGTVEEQVRAEMTDEQKNWMGGLDAEQRLKDFKSLCDGLRDNYPYLALAARQEGADLDVLEESYLDKIRECANDDAYFGVLAEFINEFGGLGHLALWGRRYESKLEDWKAFCAEPERKVKYAPYIEALENPKSQSTYAAMTAFYQEVESRVSEKLGEGDEETVAWGNVEETANVETKILEPGKTAYVSIGGFDHGLMEFDRKVLLPFYEKVRDYDNLIVDITDNPGGSMKYFDELVTAPLVRETLTVPTYQFFKDGENNRTFLRVDEGSASGLYRTVNEFPDLPKLNRDDIADCGWFLREDYTVEPTGDGFDGKIWLLVSANNYSSSEYAAMFAKASGFATLVGETTGGDGIGTDPVYLILPESGLVVQYSPMYGVTADGTGSEECGTEPDIVCPAGESALETCLGCIKQAE